MDLVQRYKTVNIISRYGKRSDYSANLSRCLADDGRALSAANIVVMEFSNEPNVYHVIKYRCVSMGDIITRDTLNKMIEVNDKAITILLNAKDQKVADGTGKDTNQWVI